MALEPIRGRRAGIVPDSRRRVICVSNFLRQRMGRCRCGDDNDVGSIPKPAGPIDGLLVEHRLLFVVSTYLVRRPKENVIQHRAIIRSPMVRRRLQQPSTPYIPCIATLNASRRRFTPTRLAGRLWPSNATLDAGGRVLSRRSKHSSNRIRLNSQVARSGPGRGSPSLSLSRLIITPMRLRQAMTSLGQSTSGRSRSTSWLCATSSADNSFGEASSASRFRPSPSRTGFETGPMDAHMRTHPMLVFDRWSCGSEAFVYKQSRPARA